MLSQTDRLLVIDERKDAHPGFDHFFSIAQMSARGAIASERFCDSDERLRRADDLDVTLLGEFLLELGFWLAIADQLVSIYPELSTYDFRDFKLSIVDPNFHLFFNVLNGNVPVDYLAAFPSLNKWDVLDKLKERKYFTKFQRDDGSPEANCASVPDLISILIFNHLNQELPPELMSEAIDLSTMIFDIRLPFDERVAYLIRLDAIYADNPISKESVGLHAKFRSLLLGLNWDFDQGKEHLRFKQDGTEVDVLLVLYHFDPEFACQRAVDIFAENPGAKFLLPGGQSPHEVQSLGQILINATEFDEMCAYVQSDGHESVLSSIPDRGFDGNFVGANVGDEDLLFTSGMSFTTSENALTSVDVLESYADEVGRQINVVLVTADAYMRRSVCQFAQSLDPSKVKMMVSCAPEYVYRNTLEGRKLAGIKAVISEWIKNLYDVCMLSSELQRNMELVLGK